MYQNVFTEFGSKSFFISDVFFFFNCTYYNTWLAIVHICSVFDYVVDYLRQIEKYLFLKKQFESGSLLHLGY